jgi:apolipoprotein N-acyltransferase
MRQAYPKPEFEQDARTRYRVGMAENTQVAPPACAVDFWTFAAPVIVGNTIALGAGLLVKRFFNNDSAKTRETAVFATKFGAFWFGAGLTWIYMAKRKGTAT